MEAAAQPAALQILALLQRLTNVLGANCAVMQPFVLPVLDYSLDVEGPEALTLVEDALALWLVTLRNVPEGAHAVLQLWPRWVQIMSTSIEHVPSCMMVASSCVLLGRADFLKVRCAQQGVQAFSQRTALSRVLRAANWSVAGGHALRCMSA
jgi:hypothetical protein